MGEVNKKKFAVLDKICGELQKKFGKGSVNYLGNSKIEPMERIPTGSVALDEITGGGYPVGRMIEFFGQESCGKSTTCYHAMAQAQKKYPDKFVALIDSEMSNDNSYASALGVNVEQLVVSQPESGQDAFAIMQGLIETGMCSLIVVDSVAALVPREETEEDDYGKSMVGVQARMMSKSLRKLSPIAARNGTTIIFTNQQRCLPLDTNVYSKNHGLTKLKDVNVGDYIYNGKEYVEIKEKIESGKVHGKKLKIKDINDFILSNNHIQPIISKGVFKEKDGKSIEIGDWVVSPIFKTDINNNFNYEDCFEEISKNQYCNVKKININDIGKSMTPELAFFLGCYYSDGSMIENDKGRKITFTQNNRERYELIKNNAINLFGEDVVKFNKNTIIINNTIIFNYLRKIGCNHLERNKIVPDDIKKSSNEIVKAFIRGAFFDTEKMPLPEMILFTNNNDAVDDINYLLYSRFGICCKTKITKRNSKQLLITGQDAQLFYKTIGFAETSKNDKTIGYIANKNARGKYDLVPREYALNIFDKFVKLKIGAVSKSGYSRYLSDIRYKNLNASRIKMIEFLESINNDNFKEELQFLKGNRFYQIIDVEETEFEAIDIEVEKELFVANNILTHNCKIGVLYGSPETTSGGSALKYYDSLRIKLTKIGSVDEGTGDDKQKIAVRIKAECVKNKTFPPFRKTEFIISFGKGIDNQTSIIQAIVQKGIVVKKGAWISYNGTNIAQGMAKFRELLEQKPDLYEQMKQKLKQKMNSGTPIGVVEQKVESETMTDEQIVEQIESEDGIESGEI